MLSVQAGCANEHCNIKTIIIHVVLAKYKNIYIF